MKKHILTIFGLLVFNSFFLTNCTKEIPPSVPEKYFVRVYNKYFEPLDSIWVDTFFFGKIPSMTTSDYKRLPSGDLSFSAITRSGLKLKALLHLTGSVEILIVHINENGNISLLQERE